MFNSSFIILKSEFWFFLLSKVTIKRSLYFFIFSAVLYGNSLFTSILPVPIVKKIYWVLAFTYSFSWMISFLTYNKFNIRMYKHIVWYFLYPLGVITSFLINYSYIDQSSFNKLRAFLIPWLISFVIMQIFNYKDIKKIGVLFFCFAVINIIVVFSTYFSDEPSYFASGFFSDRNQIARFLSIVNTFLLIVFFTTENKKLKLAISPFFILILICITFFLSRAGYLLYASSTAFVLWKTKSKFVRTAMFIAFPIILVLFAVMTSIRVKRDKMDISNASDLGRIALLKAAFNMIADKPLLGVGYGMSSSKYPSYQDKKFPGIASVKTIHNSYVAVFAEQGIIGLLFYLILNFSIMYDLFRIIKSKKHFKEFPIELFCITSLGLFLIHGLVNPTFDYVGTYWIIVVASMIVVTHNTDTLKSK